MDFSKLSQNQQLTVAAAAVVALLSFFPWFGIDGVIRFNAWNSGLTAVLGVVALVAAGVILVLESMDRSPVDSPADIVFYLAASGFGLVVLRFIFTWGAPRRFAIFLAVIAAGAVAWGALQNRADNS